MTNDLNFEDSKKFSSLDLRNFLINLNGESFTSCIINQCDVIIFSVENTFSFNVYVPQETSILELNKLKIHIFEMMWNHKKSYHLKPILPKLDSRFTNQSWIELFSISSFMKNEAAIVTFDDLLNIIKFVARLSKIKIFE